MADDTTTSNDAPAFRRWAEGAENADEFDALAANFLADYGLEMMADLVGCSVSLHRTAQEYVSKLEERFAKWWDEARPRLKSSPKLTVTYRINEEERRAHQYLEANLPPGVTFWVARRVRRVAGGGDATKAEMVDWVCRIEDGPATSGGRGPTALDAAARAVASWREFVTSSRLDSAHADASLDSSDATEGPKPPALTAPSVTGREQDESSEKRVS
jgi:hypothetical protein